MRIRSLGSLDFSVRLYLEFENLSLGEFSNILRVYQAALRDAWRVELDWP